ncbi:MAG: hypothetical protein HY073_04065 [Deltaproteobacteria bacterium]|nr:hypothetical protein [Deltaproteobacteria bacterium]
MKKIGVLLMLFCLFSWSPSSFAQGWENEEDATSPTGPFIGMQFDSFVDFQSGSAANNVKLDLLAGYKPTPFFSMGLDLWTLISIAYAAEINPRLYLPSDAAAPFLTASVGILGTSVAGVDTPMLTYSGGAGLNIPMGHLSYYLIVKYRRTTSSFSGSSANADLSKGIESGAGFQWVF